MKKNNNFQLLFLSIIITLHSFAQTAPFEVIIEPINISGLDGIQSYAFGQSNGKWLIIGGRSDGLHLRQPFSSFDVAGHNTQLIVIDPVGKQKWSAPLSVLPTSIKEQLSSTNMEFYQKGDYLYFLGGYGYSATVGDHTTYASLTAITVPDVINAVINNTSYTSYFRQISDTNFQVTGGRLRKINDTYYLLGGQKFLGRYRPMLGGGGGGGAPFTQVYTDAIRMFTINDNGSTISVNHLTPYIDGANLHRRDYNAEPEILPNGSQGITMFSGVFQKTVDLPFLNSVSVDSSGYATNNSFNQYYNHYHCPVLPIYCAAKKEMHTVFFGGIAQYYDSLGILVQDDNVPFVKTIARVTKDSTGTMKEYKLPVEMPTLLGSGAEFIPNHNVDHYANDVFKLDSIKDTTLVGYIYGGISSTQPNIFTINTGTQSSATNQIFKVLIINNYCIDSISSDTTVVSDTTNKDTTGTSSIDRLNPFSISSLNPVVFPNPSTGWINVRFNLVKSGDVKISIYDVKGSLVEKAILENLQKGENVFNRQIKNLSHGNTYLISIETSDEKIIQKLILER